MMHAFLGWISGFYHHVECAVCSGVLVTIFSCAPVFTTCDCVLCSVFIMHLSLHLPFFVRTQNGPLCELRMFWCVCDFFSLCIFVRRLVFWSLLFRNLNFFFFLRIFDMLCCRVHSHCICATTTTMTANLVVLLKMHFNFCVSLANARRSK